jgi:hypothetical protein
MIYSFSDASLVLQHPLLRTITLVGTGIGTATLNMAGDRTAHDVGADGRVMVSKIKDRRATLGLQIQQDSEANQNLLRWYIYLENAPSSEWAQITGVLKIPGSAELYTLTRMAFQKLPDRSFAAQGQQQTWNLLAADCQQDTL